MFFCCKAVTTLLVKLGSLRFAGSDDGTKAVIPDDISGCRGVNKLSFPHLLMTSCLTNWLRATSRSWITNFPILLSNSRTSDMAKKLGVLLHPRTSKTVVIGRFLPITLYSDRIGHICWGPGAGLRTYSTPVPGGPLNHLCPGPA